MSIIKDKPKPKSKVPRTFMSGAYLQQLDKRLYGLYRNIEVETDVKGIDGKFLREKLKAIGPIKLLREAKLPDEDKFVVLKTVHPTTGESIALVEVTG